MKPAHVVDPLVDAAKLPIKTTAWALGLLRGVAASVIRVAAGEKGPVGADPGTTAEHSTTTAEAEDVHEEVHEEVHVSARDDAGRDDVPPVPYVEPAPQRAPEPPHESFANEPKAVSRASAHGRGGADAEIDDWYGEVEDPEPEGGGFVLEALAAGDTDDAVQTGDLKAILSESETLRRAAEVDKG